MDNEQISRDPKILTEDQTAQVAGGLYAPVGILCRTCTSGLPVLFQAEAASLAK